MTMASGVIQSIPTNCWACKKFPPPEKLFATCAKCKLAYYCSSVCQKSDWQKHKPVCKSFAERDVTCGKCHQMPPTGTLFNACGKCKSVYYCTIACQEGAWQEHKKICKALQPESGTPVAESKVAPRDLEPTQTGYGRFFNIWADLMHRELINPGMTIGLYGMGLKQIFGKNHCPQLSESVHLWDNSTIICIDSNPAVLEAAKLIDHAEAMPFIRYTFENNQKSAKHASLMDETQNLLTRAGDRNNTVQYELFRMGVDDPTKLPKTDVIIATYSLMYPMKELWEKKSEGRLDLFIQYIARLKKGGVLYVDSNCVEYLVISRDAPKKERCLTTEKIQQCLTEIYKRSMIKLECGFLPQILGETVHETFVVKQCESYREDSLESVQTVDAFVFIRLS
jgi:hypothetical protein